MYSIAEKSAIPFFFVTSFIKLYINIPEKTIVSIANIFSPLIKVPTINPIIYVIYVTRGG